MQNSTRADIHVADFAVTHLPFRQSDIRPGSLDQRVRELSYQFVIDRFSRQSNRVSRCLRAVAPSIQHGQYNWLRSFAHRFSEYTISISWRGLQTAPSVTR